MALLLIPIRQGNDEDLEFNNSVVIPLFLFVFVLFIIVRAFLEYYELNRRKNLKFIFDILYDLHLKYKFTTQSRDTLICLKNGVRAILGPQTRRPAVLLLLFPEEATETAVALAIRLLQIVLATLSNRQTEDFIRERLFVDGSSFQSAVDFWEFYNTIRHRIKQYKVVVIYNFQAVHPHAVTILPSLTHEVFCPQSQALIVLLMSLNSYHITQEREISSTRIATACVEQTFGPALDDGQLEDLLRAITARASVIVPEKHSSESDT